MLDNVPSFKSFPKDWGIYIPYGGKPKELKGWDLGRLEWLREQLDHKQGELVSYKWDIKPLDTSLGLMFVLSRLWANNLIIKFAKQMHTQSNRPEYIKWWIWEDYERVKSITIGYDTATPVYISEG